MTSYRPQNQYSSNLYTMPFFFKGFFRIFDFFGGIDTYKTYETSFEADNEAIKRDWNIVGSDISNALQEYGTEKK